MFITKVNSNQLEKVIGLVYSTDIFNRESLVNLIKKRGVKNCQHINSFSTIESQVKELKIELLFLEIDIYKESEVQILTVFKRDKDFRNIPLVLITDDNEIKNASYARELGFDDILVKPFNFPAIKELIDDLIKKYNKNDNWYILNSIEKLIEDNNLEMAIKYINALENKINDFYIKYLKSLYFFKKKKYEESIKELKLLLMFKPTCFPAYKLLTQCYEITKDHKKKLEALEKVILFSPKNPSHNFDIGKSYLENNNEAKAEKHLRYVEKINPKHSGLNASMANLYIKKGDNQKAQKYLKRLSKGIHTLSIKDLNEIGMNLNKAGDKKEALEYFNRAWELSKKEKKDDGILLFNMSSVYFELEKYEKALFYINLAIKAKKNFIVAKKLKSKILLKATLKNNE